MSIVNSLSEAVGAVAKAAGVNLPSFSSNPSISPAENKHNEVFKGEELWSIAGDAWYKVFGFQFQIEVSGKETLYYTLPIPPQSMMIKPVMANRATATIGGVVEETSQVTFWIISMSGTTGTSVGRKENDSERKSVAKKFRSAISTTGLLSGVAAQVNSVLGKVGGAIDQLSSAFSGGGSANVIGNVVGAVNNALTPPLPYLSSAVDQQSNGFTEAQELQKFFYIYQKLKGSFPDTYNLYFVNYKTDQKWRVIVKDFSLSQSAQNPNLYKYQISLQGWDVRRTGKDNKEEAYDRFGADGDLKSVNTIGVENAKQTQNKLLKLKDNLFKNLPHRT